MNDHLTEILFGKTRRAILSVVYGHADEMFYLRLLFVEAPLQWIVYFQEFDDM